MKLSLPFLLWFCLSSATLCIANENPFFGADRDTNSNSVPDSREKRVENRARSDGAWKRIPFGSRILALQRKLTADLSRNLKLIKNDPKPGPIAVLLLTSFIYGIIHSVGPGHAKALFVSHTMARPSSAATIWKAGGIFSITHIGTAVVLFLVLRETLGLTVANNDTVARKMIRLSGFLVITAGLMVLFSSILEHAFESAAGRLMNQMSGLSPTAFVAGLAPCPGTFLILTFSSIIGILPVGLFAVVAVSLGMAVTVGTAGSIGGLMARKVVRNGRSPGWRYVRNGISFLGGGAVIVIGILMTLN